MEKDWDIIEYKRTCQVELLNDLSMSAYNKLLRFLVNKNLSEIEEENLFFMKVLYQFEGIMDINLFKKDFCELKEIKDYWDNMNKFKDEVTKGDDNN